MEVTTSTTSDTKWYFKFDPTTFAFIPGAIRAEEQPENTTTVEPSGLINPVWNPNTISWTGQSMDDYLAEQRANQPKVVDSNQQALNATANVLLTRLIAQDKRIAELESKEAK